MVGDVIRIVDNLQKACSWNLRIFVAQMHEIDQTH